MEQATSDPRPATAGAAAPADPPQSSRLPVAGIILVLGTLLQLVRIGGERAFDTMWAEDGTKFYQESGQGLWATLGESYAGYLHGVPRAWAWLAGLFPVEWAPAVISVGAALTVSAIAAYAYAATGNYIRQQSLRLVLAAFILCVPLARYEAVANLTNLHWYLLAGITLAALADQRSPGIRAASVVLVLGATTSEGLAILLAPVFIGLWWIDRSRGRAVVLATYLVGSTAQVLVMLTDRGLEPAPGDDGRLDGLLLPGVYVTRVLAPAFVGEPVVQRTFVLGLDVGSLAIVVLAALLIAFVAGYALLRPGVPDRRSAIILLIYSGVFFGAPMLVHGDIDRFAAIGGHEGISHGARYFIAPSILLVAAVLALLSHRDPRTSEKGWRLIRRLAVTAILLSLVAALPAEPLEQDHPSWSEQVEEAETYCRENPGATTSEAILIQPAGWLLPLACDSLTPAD